MKSLSLLSFLLFGFIFSYSNQSTAVKPYANDCIDCLLNGNDFCSPSAVTPYTTGDCCSGMAFAGDICLSNTYCTFTSTTYGAKFAKCPTPVACGDVTNYFMVLDKIENFTVDINGAGICNYQIFLVFLPSYTNFTNIDWH